MPPQSLASRASLVSAMVENRHTNTVNYASLGSSAGKKPRTELVPKRDGGRRFVYLTVVNCLLIIL